MMRDWANIPAHYPNYRTNHGVFRVYATTRPERFIPAPLIPVMPLRGIAMTVYEKFGFVEYIEDSTRSYHPRRAFVDTVDEYRGFTACYGKADADKAAADTFRMCFGPVTFGPLERVTW